MLSQKEGESDLVCICREVDDGTKPLVACDDCNEWFHPACLGINPEVPVLYCCVYHLWHLLFLKICTSSLAWLHN